MIDIDLRVFDLIQECPHCHMRRRIPLARRVGVSGLVWRAYPAGIDALQAPSVMTMRDWRMVIERAEAYGWFILAYSRETEERCSLRRILAAHEPHRGKPHGPTQGDFSDYMDSEGFLFKLSTLEIGD